jgi:hypothetical protein
MDFEGLGADVEFVARAEGISRVDGHPCNPFAEEQPFMITEIATKRRPAILIEK